MSPEIAPAMVTPFAVSGQECAELMARLASVAASGVAEVEGPGSGGPGGAHEVGDAAGVGLQSLVAAEAQALELIGAFEALKSALCAAQARLSVQVDRCRRSAETAQGVAASRRGRGVAAQIALARRESPVKGSRLLGLGKALVTEMPHTLAALTRGELNEWRAILIARETAVLDADDRRAVDAALDLSGVARRLSDRALAARARALAYQADPQAPLTRGRHAVSQRYVSLRPAPDTMTVLTAYLPVVEGVACYAALQTHATSAITTGDPRGKGQLMADTLIARLTRREAGVGPDIEVNLVMTDTALLDSTMLDTTMVGTASPDTRVLGTSGPGTSGPGTSEPMTAAPAGIDPVHQPAHLVGYGPIPATLARALLSTEPSGAENGPVPTSAAERAQRSDPGGARVPQGAQAPDADEESRRRARVWLRRLYVDPVTGVLNAMDTRRRAFSDAQRRFLILRDGTCRTPWCGAPIRDADHAQAWATRGPTHTDNGQGLCRRCNLAKETPGWHTTASAVASPATATGTTGSTGTTGTTGTRMTTAPAAIGVTTTMPSGVSYTTQPPPLLVHHHPASRPASWNDGRRSA